MSLFEFLFTAQAWASSAAAEHHGPSIHEIWFPVGNFLIFAFIIVRFALPAVRAFLHSRREEVLATIEELSAKKQRAEALVNDYRGRLAGLDKEVAALQASLRDDGEREKNKLLSEAKTLAVKIKEDAGFLADQEFNIARQKAARGDGRPGRSGGARIGAAQSFGGGSGPAGGRLYSEHRADEMIEGRLSPQIYESAFPTRSRSRLRKNKWARRSSSFTLPIAARSCRAF